MHAYFCKSEILEVDNINAAVAGELSLVFMSLICQKEGQFWLAFKVKPLGLKAKQYR